MRRVLAVLGCVVALAGCSGDDDAGDDGDDVPVLTVEVPAITSGPAGTVAPAVPATTPGGSDPVCAQLAADVSLTGLGEVVRQAAVSGVAPDVAAPVAALEAVAGSFPSAGSAAQALRAWAAVPGDATVIDGLAAAFALLETEVQAICQFPLG